MRLISRQREERELGQALVAGQKAQRQLIRLIDAFMEAADEGYEVPQVVVYALKENQRENKRLREIIHG